MKIYNEDINTLFNNNENGDSGFFPIGRDGLWHSGIHLHLEHELSPIQEGEVVAYRLSSDYQTYEVTLKDKKDKTEKKVENKFSSNFVLLRHNVDIAMNKKKRTISFFSMYMSLLPDSCYEIVKQYNDFKELNDSKKIITPFYRTWEFKINPQKSNNYYCYNGNVNIFPHSKGAIDDNNYLLQKRNSYLRCKMQNGSIDTIDTQYLKFPNKEEKIHIRLLPLKNYYSIKDFSKRGYTTACDVYASYPPVFENNTSYLKIISNGKQLKHNTNTGYVFQRQVKKLVPGDSPYRYIDENQNIYRLPMYDIKKVTDIDENMFVCCKYGLYKDKIESLKKTPQIKLFFSNWDYLNNKQPILEDCNANFTVKVPHLQFDRERTVVFCNNKAAYNWLKSGKLPDDLSKSYYDFQFADINNKSIPYIAYVDEATIKLIKKEKINIDLDSKLFLCSIKANGQYVYSSENMKIEEDKDICVLSNSLLHKVSSNLRESADTEWFVEAKDVTLLQGPTIELADANQNLRNYTLSSTKGLLCYSLDGHPYKIIKQDEVFTILNPNQSLTEKPRDGKINIFVENKEYLLKISNWNYLIGRTILKNNIELGDSIKKPKADEIYLTPKDFLGFGSEYDFSEKKGKNIHDLVVFFKDNSFLSEKDKKDIHIAKTEKEVFSVEVHEKPLMQRFPTDTTFSIVEEINVFSHKCYKIKITKVPIYFSNKQSTSEKNKQLKISNNMDICWVYDCIVTKDKVTSGTSIKEKECTIVSKILQVNLNSLKGQCYPFINQNSTKTASKCLVDLGSYSGEYYIVDTENCKIDEKNKELTVKTMDKQIEFYTKNPFEIKKQVLKQALKSKNSPIKDIEFEHDDGGIVKYNNAEYMAFEAVNQSFFINKNDIETRNLYDWEDIFNIQQSSKNNKDDIFCDAKEEIIDNFKTENLSESEKKQIDKFKDAINSSNSGEMIQEAYNDKIEGVTRQLRKMIVKHPLEWNSTIYNNLTEKDFRNHDNPITPDDLKQLQDLMEKLSVWNDIKSIKGIDSQETLYFAHPLVFMEHLDKLQQKTVPFLLEKWGERITSRKGNIFSLDNGKGKLLSNVEWYSQRDNVGDNTNGVFGYNMCQLTSLAMTMNAMGIKRLNAGGQYEDELYSYAKLAGYGGSKLWTDTAKVYEKVTEKYNIELTWYSNEIVKHAKEIIDKGKPFILSMDYKEDGLHGHVIVAVGYTDNTLIINDPYGDNNTGYSEHNGAFVEYQINRWYLNNKWGCYIDE